MRPGCLEVFWTKPGLAAMSIYTNWFLRKNREEEVDHLILLPKNYHIMLKIQCLTFTSSLFEMLQTNSSEGLLEESKF